MAAHTSGRAASIDLTVTLNRNPVHVPSPATDARLKVFADAFMHCQQLAGRHLEPAIRGLGIIAFCVRARPTAVLGTLAWHQSLPAAHPAASGQPQSQVALIRNPHFVVAYRDVPADPSGGNTFGVFLGSTRPRPKVRGVRDAYPRRVEAEAGSSLRSRPSVL